MRNLDELRDEVEGWIRKNWDADLTMRQWWRLLAESGYSVPDWPRECMGLGLSGREAAAVREAIAAERVPGPPAGVGMMMAGPAIIAHGTDDQRARYLPGIVTGEVNWCQLFSEPGAGSDLAGLRTAARESNAGWIVNGQKVWTSNAHLADMGMLLARTDPSAEKHAGITWFAFDMEQSGVETRALREMTGRSLFSEVFIADALVPYDAVIGGVGKGWTVARTTLAAERAALASGVGAVGGVPGSIGGLLSTSAGEVAERLRQDRRPSGTSIAMRGQAFELLKQLGSELGKLHHSQIRDRLVRVYMMEETSRQLGLRARAVANREHHQLPFYGPVQKLRTTESLRQARDLALEMLGPAGMLDGSAAQDGGAWQEMALFSCAVSIFGGTDEIQRNIIAERFLGLPRWD
jgi:alkylation response protein AidB-like acyl-CoA dehydrogenase